MPDRFPYTIVRVVPDLLRGEMLNVGLVGAYHGQLLCRSLGTTRCIESMLDVQRRVIASDFPSMIREAFVGGFPSYSENGVLVLSEAASPAFIEYLHRDGFAGLYFDELREVTLPEPTLAAAEYVFNALFHKLVAPQSFFTDAPLRTRSRVKTIVGQLIDSIDRTGEHIAQNVRVREQKTKATYNFDFAFANGKPTLGQTLDLEVGARTKRSGTDHAIANIAELRRLGITSNTVGWLSVVNVREKAEDSVTFLDRLRNWGRVIQLPGDREFLEQLLKYEAKNDVGKALADHFQVTRTDDELEVVINATEEPSLRGT